GRSAVTKLPTANISHLFTISVMTRACNVSEIQQSNHEDVNICRCTGNDLWVRLQ
ncbi:hypothetical protein P692DRAFT_20726819, partial [Suillus brevipes Sb2]